MPEERAERDRIARALDVLIAVIAVEVRASERDAEANAQRQPRAAQPMRSVNADWTRRRAS